MEDVRQLKGKKLLFPLHVTPEASTDVWAPQFNDMLQTATRIVEHLPPDWTLVMKEHPTAIYLQRNPSELEALRALPRSILVSPLASNEELLKECVLLVISSTLGLEALVKGYPLITLGKPFFDASGNTLALDDFARLPEVLRDVLHFKPAPLKTERFIARYFDCTNPGNPVNPQLFPNLKSQIKEDLIAEDFASRFLKSKP